MDMLVPLDSPEAALFSKTDTFEYVPPHIADPALDNNVSPVDYVLTTPRLKDMNDPTVPDHVRKGVAYDPSEIVEFNPEVGMLEKYINQDDSLFISQFDETRQDYIDRIWVSESSRSRTAIVVSRAYVSASMRFNYSDTV